jgi:hypothetical protein
MHAFAKTSAYFSHYTTGIKLNKFKHFILIKLVINIMLVKCNIVNNVISIT